MFLTSLESDLDGLLSDLPAVPLLQHCLHTYINTPPFELSYHISLGNQTTNIVNVCIK